MAGLAMGVAVCVYGYFFISQEASDATDTARTVRAQADAITDGWCWERQQFLGRQAAWWFRFTAVALRALAVCCLAQAATLVVLMGTLAGWCPPGLECS